MNSYERTKSHFDKPQVVHRYPAAYRRRFRDVREVACVLKALRHVPQGSRVLDLPCGTGRLLPVLVKAGYHVVAADSSAHMVQQARCNWNRLRDESPAGMQEIEFRQSDVMHTDFSDAEFGAVVCSRLFHHFVEPQTRIAALRELRRISQGPIVVSFFNSFSLDAVKARLKHAVRGTVVRNRVAIPRRVFAAEIRDTGLRVTSAYPILWGLSWMWYLVLLREGAHESSNGAPARLRPAPMQTAASR